MSLLLGLGIPMTYIVIAFVAARICYVYEQTTYQKAIDKRDSYSYRSTGSPEYMLTIFGSTFWPILLVVLAFVIPGQFLIKRFVLAPTPYQKKKDREEIQREELKKLRALAAKHNLPLE